MSRTEAREKGWNTFRENLKKYAEDNSEFSLDDFILERLFGAYGFWRNARIAERRRDFSKARLFYSKAVESLEQAEKISEVPAAIAYVNNLKAVFFDFVVHRDPHYRANLKHLLPLIKDEPGILQTETYKKVQIAKSEAAYTLYFAEKEGLIRREEKGRSYLLFFERDKPENESLSTIQDDDVDLLENAEQEAAAREGCLLVFTFVFWFIALGVAWAIGEMVGVGIVASAFIIWLIVRKRLQKKRKTEDATQAQAVVLLPGQPEKSEQKEVADEKDE